MQKFGLGVSSGNATCVTQRDAVFARRPLSIPSTTPEVYDVEFMRMFARELMDLLGRVREWKLPYVDVLTGTRVQPDKKFGNAYSINKSVGDLVPYMSSMIAIEVDPSMYCAWKPSLYPQPDLADPRPELTMEDMRALMIKYCETHMSCQPLEPT